MKATLIIGGLGVALVVVAPAVRALRLRPGSRMTDEEYFAAARKRAISYRLAQSASSQGERQASGTEQDAR